MRVIEGIEGLRALAGQELGRSGWLTVTQEMVDRFAEITGDDQWIHVDPVRAERESPFGGTVAHGYLTLALIPRFAREIFTLEGIRTRINYGLDKVRFPAAVRCGSRIRGAMRIDTTTPVPNGGLRYAATVTIEIEGGDKPACIAQVVVVVFP